MLLINVWVVREEKGGRKTKRREQRRRLRQKEDYSSVDPRANICALQIMIRSRETQYILKIKS